MGNDKYKLAATSEDGVKKPKRGKKSKKDMEELKKEVELVWNYLQFYFIKHTNLLKSHITLALKTFNLKTKLYIIILSKTFKILPV